MSRYTATIEVPLGIDRAFELWTDAARFPQWQSGVLRVSEPSGSTRVAGSTLRLDMGPKMRRTATIIESARPARHVAGQSGLGSTDETTAEFDELDLERTRIRVSVNLEVGLGPVGRVMERLTYGQTAKQLRKELDRFAEVAARSMIDLSPGSLITVDCNASFRVAKIIELDDGRVHIALMPGLSSKRPSDVRSFLDNESRLADPLSLKPLPLGLRGATSLAVRGQPLLALDGGVGVPHLALTEGAFVDSLPQTAGAISVFPEESAEVASWRAAAGPVLGDDLDATIGPIVSMPAENGYRGAKILRVNRAAVHVRVYSDRWAVPPDFVDPWSLRLDPFDAPDPGIGHLPVSHASFASWDPAFERLAMVGSAELDGLRHWEESGGGVFA